MLLEMSKCPSSLLRDHRCWSSLKKKRMIFRKCTIFIWKFIIRRYKSLSSLQLTPDSTTPISTAPNGHEKIINHKLSKSASTQCAREGTLDSSRSGGRTSGESKLPEKKTRRLSRPRSLSNLVWELRPQKDKSKKKLYVHHFDHRQQGTLYL